MVSKYPLLQTVYKIFSVPAALVSGLAATLFVWAIGWYFTNLDLTIGNMGHSFAYIELTIYVIFCLLFGLFVAATVYKLLFFRKAKNNSTLISWWIWSVFATLVAWCPACSITLASYLWLASVISFLPWKGMELKIIWVTLLGRALWKTLLTLESCKISSHKKKSPFSFLYLITTQRVIVWLGVISVVIVSWRKIYANYAEQKKVVSEAPTVVIEQDVVGQDSVYIPSSPPSVVCSAS